MITKKIHSELAIHDTNGHVLHAIVLGSNDDVVDVDEML